MTFEIELDKLKKTRVKVITNNDRYWRFRDGTVTTEHEKMAGMFNLQEVWDTASAGKVRIKFLEL